MSALKGDILVTPQEIYTVTTTQGTDLGARATTGDGRVYRYALNGAVAVLPGKVYQGAAQDTTNQNPSGGISVAAAAVGATQITLTSSLTLAANLLSGGFMSVNVTPGQGYTYKVRSNTAVAAAANCVVTLEDPIQVALTTASKVVFSLGAYNGIVVTPATLTAAIAGVGVSPIAVGGYGWIQTRGPVSALVAGTPAVGTGVGCPAAGTIGAFGAQVAGGAIAGHMLGTGVAAEYDLVQLCLD